MLEANKRDVREFLPEITVERIAPPYLTYPCFRGRELYPFRPDAATFDMVNAWWLMEATILAWAEKDFGIEGFQNSGFSEVQFFDGDSTQCYLANNDDFLILVFRGTEIRPRPGKTDFCNIVTDIVADARILLVDSGQGGKVHQGFKDALDEVWGEKGLHDQLRSKDNGARTFWFTGHSLGAPLATLAAQRYGDVRGLYTYGSPRVGDLDFKNGFPVKTYRFVNNNDVVTKVPPPGLYQHVGDLKHIDPQGFIHEEPDTLEEAVNDIQLEIVAFLNSLEGMRTDLDALIPEEIVDHVPILYATHIWNNIP
jgi:triacylglycerol lipase